MERSIRFLLLPLLLLLQLNSKAQLIVTNLKENRLYYGVDNPVDFAFKGFDTSQIKLEVSQGILRKDEDGKLYWKLFGEKHGLFITFYARLKKSGRIVDSVYFMIKHLPDPVIEYAGGDIWNGVFFSSPSVHMIGFYAALRNSQYDSRWNVVDTYAVSFYKNDTKLYTTSNGTEGATLSQKIRLKMIRFADYGQSLKNTDSIWAVFHDFKVNCACEDSVRKLNQQVRIRINTDTSIKKPYDPHLGY